MDGGQFHLPTSRFKIYKTIQCPLVETPVEIHNLNFIQGSDYCALKGFSFPRKLKRLSDLSLWPGEVMCISFYLEDTVVFGEQPLGGHLSNIHFIESIYISQSKFISMCTSAPKPSSMYSCRDCGLFLL